MKRPTTEDFDRMLEDWERQGLIVRIGDYKISEYDGKPKPIFQTTERGKAVLGAQQSMSKAQRGGGGA
jgi:DNA-binding PadR family transcriptional regulator